jgi:hypothetical protein
VIVTIFNMEKHYFRCARENKIDCLRIF